MNNKNYRVMKFFEPVNKQDKSRGYVRLDIRGIKGNILVSVENPGDVKATSEVYLYKDRVNKIKLGDINSKKGMIKKLLTFGSNNAIEDYNICAVVRDKKIVMYSNLFNAISPDQIRKLEADDQDTINEEIANLEDTSPEVVPEPMETAAEIKKPNTEEVKTFKEVIKEEKVSEKKTEVTEEETKIAEETKTAEKTKTVEETKTIEEEKKFAAEPIKKTTVSSAVNIDENITEPEKNEEPKEAVQSQARKYRNKFDESLYNVLKDYKQVEPLSVKINNFNWWYIPYDETGVRNGFLPYYNQIISSYYPYPMSNRVTTCSGLMKKYGHYVFGIYKENGEIVKFVYGVPGEFTKEEQPYKGITGFKNWSYSNKENYDKHGYWLAFVNPKTGETTEPPQIVLT
jgi:hypothetical protein